MGFGRIRDPSDPCRVSACCLGVVPLNEDVRRLLFNIANYFTTTTRRRAGRLGGP